MKITAAFAPTAARMFGGRHGRRAATTVLAALGAAAFARVIADVGLPPLVRVVTEAFPVVLGLAGLEVLVALADTAAARALYGDRDHSSWTRGARAYLVAQLAPGAQGTAEIVRAAGAASRIGKGRAARSALELHGARLVVVALGAALCSTSVLVPGGDPTSDEPALRVALVGLSGWCATLGLLLLGTSAISPRALDWLVRRAALPTSEGPPARIPCSARVEAFVWVLAARTLHGLQAWLATALLIETGASQVAAVEALQLLAAAVGDAVPLQLGVFETTFHAFAAHVAPELSVAVSVALALRIARMTTMLGVAGVLLVAGGGADRNARRPVAAGVVALVVTTSMSVAIARAEDVPARGERTDAILRQRAVVAFAPFGLEHMLTGALRYRWDDGQSPLLDGTHLEVGALSQLSPVDAILGGYVSLSPWAFLTLRAELASMFAWSLGELGSGFSALEAPDAPIPAQGAQASGFRARVEATLAFAAQLGPLRPILHAQLGLEHEELGDVPYRWSARHDRALPRGAWMVASLAHALVELRLTSEVQLRVGAFDDVRAALGAGPPSHAIGPVSMLVIAVEDPVLDELTVLVRAGVRLDETARADEWTSLLALFAQYTP